ncbi:MAG: 2-oxoacid:acceptor oxidoreductase subunit alpha [Cyanobacteriota bacterium]
MSQNNLVVQIAGASGEGAISAGDVLAAAAARCGLNVTTDKIYPAEVRGSGSTMYQLRMSSEPTWTPGEESDLMFALNEQILDIFCDSIKEGGYLFYDYSETSIESVNQLNLKINKIPVPFTRLSKEIDAAKAKNMIALGVFTGIVKQVDFESQIIKDIETKFKHKGDSVLNTNITAFEAGINYAKETIKNVNLSQIILTPSTDGKLVMTGNEAVAFGALVAGCRFYAGYPITPATDVMEWIAAEMPKLGGSVILAEDEIAAIIMTIGASYAGLRSFTATSGPGLSLMSEAIGLAGMAEIPLVIVDVQRGGPSTGLPTKPEQGDLSQAVFGTHGDTPKIVIAPTNVEDCFYQTVNAFNLAEKYQLPVILLSDQSIGQRRESVNPINLKSIERLEREWYKPIDKTVPYLRYGITPTGVSPMSYPGLAGGTYVATGLEHNELSAPSYHPKVHAAMTEKRFRKLQYAKYDFHSCKKYGDPTARIGFITWGSSTMPVLEGIKLAEKEGYKAEVMYPKILYPMPDSWINEFIANKDIIIFPERNFVGQIANIVIPKFTLEKAITIIRMNKYDSQNFTPTEIYNKIKELCEEE